MLPNHIIHSFDKWRNSIVKIEEKLIISHKDVVSKYNAFNKVFII